MYLKCYRMTPNNGKATLTKSIASRRMTLMETSGTSARSTGLTSVRGKEAKETGTRVLCHHPGEVWMRKSF